MTAPFHLKKLDPKQKKQAITAASLFAVIIVLGIWDLRGTVTTSAHAVQPRADVTTPHAKLKNAAAGATALPNSFHLRLDELARAESIEYSANSHNLFSSAPSTPIEAPIASPRPAPVADPTPVVKEAPAKPTFDIKYQGYAVSEPGKMDGLFMRGDDMSVARAGDIIFHRFRVVSVQPGSAQLTDLVSNQTQPVLVASAK
jgi:hypothetical protein